MIDIAVSGVAVTKSGTLEASLKPGKHRRNRGLSWTDSSQNFEEGESRCYDMLIHWQLVTSGGISLHFSEAVASLSKGNLRSNSFKVFWLRHCCCLPLEWSYASNHTG